MAECGICLDALRSPVSVPCGHVHCEKCLRGHISSGADALRSTCPTCRKSFYIATPDFTFVPQKYHEFILPSVRKIYMDIPSVTALTDEVSLLTQRVEALVKENEHLRQHYINYRDRLENTESELRVATEREEDARQEADGLQKKYESLKMKYREIRSCDDEYSAIGHRCSQKSDNFREILPKEEHSEDLSPDLPRPKRTLPRSRLSNNICRKDEQAIQVTKRQRTNRRPDVGSSSQCKIVFKSEDEDE